MTQFLYGLQWGLGFFSALGIFMVVFFIILAGLVGISNITKKGLGPTTGPGQ